MINMFRARVGRLVSFAILAYGFTAAFSSNASAQLLTFSKQDLIDYTAQNPFDRLPDGRPKVPDDLVERARGLSAEEIWEVLEDKGFPHQYADGFQVLHPGKTMVGRAFTVQFSPFAQMSVALPRQRLNSTAFPA